MDVEPESQSDVGIHASIHSYHEQPGILMIAAWNTLLQRKWKAEFILFSYVCMQVCMYVGKPVCMYVCMYVSMYACMYVCMCVCISLYVYIYIYIYIYIIYRL